MPEFGFDLSGFDDDPTLDSLGLGGFDVPWLSLLDG